MSRDLEDVLREIGELSNIHADRKKLRANLLEIRDHRLAYYNQSNEKELQLSLIHISEPTRLQLSRMPSSA